MPVLNKDLTPNMTSEKLDEIMSTMPEHMEEGELCALTLTIHNAYMDNAGDIINNLIATIYTIGMSSGLSRETISMGLRRVADIQAEEYSQNEKLH